MDEKVLKEALECLIEQEITDVLESMEARPKHKFSPEFESKMQMLTKKANKRYVSIGRHSIRRAVLIAIIAALLLTGCVGIKPVREAIIQYWIDITEKNTTISIEKDKEKVDESFDVKKLTIPTGYHIVSENLLIEHGWYDCDYENSEKDLISYMQVRLENMVTNVDTEGAEVKELQIHGYNMKLIINRGMSNIIWMDDTYFYHLCGTCGTEELKKIIEDSI